MATLIHCPSCDRQLRVPENLLGRTVRCPDCQQTFTSSRPGAAAPAPPEPQHAEEEPIREGIRLPEHLPSRQPRIEEEDEAARYEEDEDLPRRARRLGTPASSQVMGPAVALMVLSIVDVIMALLTIALHLFGMVMVGTQGPSPRTGPAVATGNSMDMWVQAAQIPFGLLELVVAGVLLFGALKMKNLDSYGWALAACILALIPSGCCSFGVCGAPCIALHLPFGIWGLVVLSHSEVKEAFR